MYDFVLRFLIYYLIDIRHLWWPSVFLEEQRNEVRGRVQEQESSWFNLPLLSLLTTVCYIANANYITFVPLLTILNLWFMLTFFCYIIYFSCRRGKKCIEYCLNYAWYYPVRDNSQLGVCINSLVPNYSRFCLSSQFDLFSSSFICFFC